MIAIIPRELDGEIKENLSHIKSCIDRFLKYDKINFYEDYRYFVIRYYLLFGTTQCQTDQKNQEILFSRYKCSFVVNAGGYGQNSEPSWYGNYDSKVIEEIIYRKKESILQAKSEGLTVIGTLSTRPKMFESKPFPYCFGENEIKFSSDMFKRISKEMDIHKCVLILYFADIDKYFGMTPDSEPVKIRLKESNSLDLNK